MGGRAGHADDGGQPRRPQLASLAEPDDALLELAGCLVRTTARAARSVLESGVALSEPPMPPLRRGLARHVRRLGGRADRPARRDPLAQTASTFDRERSVTVHLSLLAEWVAFDSSTLARRLNSFADRQQRPWTSHLAVAAA